MSSRCRGGIARERSSTQPMMNGMEKSDSAMVAMKPANKGASAPAEPVEPGGQAQGESGRPGHAPDTRPGKRDTGG